MVWETTSTRSRTSLTTARKVCCAQDFYCQGSAVKERELGHTCAMAMAWACLCHRIENRTCSRAHFRKITIISVIIIVTWISSCKAHTTFGGCDVGSVGWVLGGCDVGIISIGITIILKWIVEHMLQEPHPGNE